MTSQAAPQAPPPDPGPAAGVRTLPRTSSRRLLADRAARWMVTAGGIIIIASILGILLFILIEVAPLGRPARVSSAEGLRLDSPAGALAGDPHRTHIAHLSRDGRLRVRRLADGALAVDRPVSDSAFLATASARGDLLMGSTGDGRLVVVPVDWEITYEANVRQVTPATPEIADLILDPAGAALGAFAAVRDEAGSLTAAAQLQDGRIAVVQRTMEESFLTGERTESVQRRESEPTDGVTALALDQSSENLFGGTEDGRIAWWKLNDGRPEDRELTDQAGAGITSLTLLLGDRSLVVGRADGALEIWFAARQEDGASRLQRIREFPAYPGTIRHIEPSGRNKGFLAADSTGRLGLHYSTSARTLWTHQSPTGAIDALLFSPKADGIYMTAGHELAAFDVDNPHPEISLSSLFGRVWYEGYPEPEFVWQSSGGTDDFEPKLSLVPLMVGTLKGTFYSLLLSIPLGVLAAMYTSQFMHPRLRRIVKPAVEIMAALPSVVLGFLAGLWLAPRIERAFPALLLMSVVLPGLILLAGLGWRRIPRRLRNRFPDGAEVLLHCVALGVGIWLCLQLNASLEGTLFGGDFQAWLLQITGLTYDQRNAFVVGLAMGFAVIPIIFAISEDAFSNVPRNLSSGSLALGANRWQTVTQVILPTASPGIFSGVMVGFGRAIGETMIVLMATGNTPILDWSPFNGFRTLSANIAVEIPEAPLGGTLYRTLFLAALLLFMLTFLVNTAAELVRQRLRRRYAEL